MNKHNRMILEGLNQRFKNEFGSEIDPCSKCGEHMKSIHHNSNEWELICEDCHTQWLSELN